MTSCLLYRTPGANSFLIEWIPFQKVAALIELSPFKVHPFPLQVKNSSGTQFRPSASTNILPNLQKMYLWTRVPSEGSDQPAHSRSLIRIFTGHIFDRQSCKFSSCGKEDADRTARMGRLILVSVGCTCRKIRFLTLRSYISCLLIVFCL